MAWTSAVNTSLLTTYLIKKFIPTLEAELQFSKFGMKAIVPPGSGKVARWNVFSNPPGTTTALSEGYTFFETTTNQITTLTTTGTEATIQEFGEWIKVSELQEIAQVKGSRDALVKRMAYGGALSLDSQCRNQFDGTTAALSTAFYASDTAATGGSTTAAIPGKGSASAIIGAAKLLRDISNTKGMGFSGVSGHPDGDYAAIVTPKFELDMVTEGTTNRITWQNAVVNVPGNDGQGRFVKGYMGRIYGTACYRTQNYTQTTVTSLSDNNFILSEGGLGCLGFGDTKARVVLNDVNSPYKNASSVAWHAYFAAKGLDSNRVIRLYSNSV